MSYTATSLTAYESFLESLSLYPYLSQHKTVEMDLRGALNPSHLLDEYFFSKNQWLTFEEFYEAYLEKFKDTIRETFSFKEERAFTDGLRARLYRTQFGFLTEYHAFFIATLLLGQENTHRAPALDTAGVDFRVRIAGRAYNVHIFVDTPRAWSFRIFKSQYKNSESIPGIHVNLPYSLRQGRFNSLRFLKNGFGVYTEQYLNYFRNEAEAGKIQNNNITGTTKDGFIYSGNNETPPE